MFPKVSEFAVKDVNFNGEICLAGSPERRPSYQISPLKLVCAGNSVNRDSLLVISDV